MSRKVSIIIPVRNEEQRIGTVIENIIAQTYPLEQMEVLFVDGRSTDRTREIIEMNCKDVLNFQVLDNPKEIAAAAMNVGITKAAGDILIRMDGHSEYGPNYVDRCVFYLLDKDADNVGCPFHTVGDSFVGRCIAYVYSSSFGAGVRTFRTGAQGGYTNAVPYGCFRKSLIERIGGFCEHLERTEDNEFNRRIIANGGKIYMFTDDAITYHVRESVGTFLHMGFKNGYWGGKTAVLKPGIMGPRYGIPLLFLLSVGAFGLVMSFNLSLLKPLFYCEFLTYLVLDLYFTLKGIWKGKLEWYGWLLVLFLYPAFHLIYGVGTLWGIGQGIDTRIRKDG